MEFCRRIGKTPVLMRKEVPGFIVNCIFRALTREAVSLLEGGYASAEDIDLAVVKGLGHPMNLRCACSTRPALTFVPGAHGRQQGDRRPSRPSPTSCSGKCTNAASGRSRQGLLRVHPEGLTPSGLRYETSGRCRSAAGVAAPAGRHRSAALRIRRADPAGAPTRCAGPGTARRAGASADADWVKRHWTARPGGAARRGDLLPRQGLARRARRRPGKGAAASAVGHSRLVRAWRDQRADVLLLQVSPPDDSGHVSLGISLDYMRAVQAQRPLVVAEINPRMPRTCGDTHWPIEQIDWFVEGGEGPQQVSPGAADTVDQQIARHVGGPGARRLVGLADRHRLAPRRRAGTARPPEAPGPAQRASSPMGYDRSSKRA